MNDPKGIRLDFSQYHDIGHRWGTAYCRAQYGGFWHHLHLWWEYKFEYRPRDIWARIRCKMGHHTWTEVYSGTPFEKNLNAPDKVICWWCDAEL